MLRNKGRQQRLHHGAVSTKPSISRTGTFGQLYTDPFGQSPLLTHNGQPETQTAPISGISNCSGGVPQERSREGVWTHTDTYHTLTRTRTGWRGGVRGITTCGSALVRSNTRRSCGGFRCSLHTNPLPLREESYSSEVCFQARPRRPVIGLVHTRLTARQAVV